MPIHRSAIAYVRVSTDQQFDGNGLDLQLEKIRAYAAAKNVKIRRTYREVGSGVGEDSLQNRDEFQEALKLAQEKRWPIFVADISRVGRHEQTVMEKFDDRSIKIESAEDGAFIDPAVVAAQARQAERTARIISRETKAALAAVKKRGVLLGNRTNLGEAQTKGAATNAERFQKRVIEYRQILRQIDAEGIMTRKQIVDALNERGLRTDRGLLWTFGNFRRLHDAIRDLEQMGIPSSETEPTFEERQAKDPLWGAFA